MLINKIPIHLFGAKQLTVDFGQTMQNTTYEWNPGARLPILVDNRTTFKTLEITMKVTGENREEINQNISNVHKLAAGEAEYNLDGYSNWVFVGVLADAPTSKKTIDARVYKLTLRVNGYMRDKKEREINLDKVLSQYIYAEGTRDTPILIEITPDIDLTKFTITGVAERGIEIKNLTKGNTIYIDGLTGLVTENGQNKFNDVIMFEFPHLQAGEQLIAFSENVCHVKIKYYPMWL